MDIARLRISQILTIEFGAAWDESYAFFPVRNIKRWVQNRPSRTGASLDETAAKWCLAAMSTVVCQTRLWWRTS
jgi:hypothetical protein